MLKTRKTFWCCSHYSSYCIDPHVSDEPYWKFVCILLDEGDIYVTPDQERIIAKRGRNVESYQIDSHQLEFTVPTDNGPISCHALSNAYFIFSVKQKTGTAIYSFFFHYLMMVRRFQVCPINLHSCSK